MTPHKQLIGPNQHPHSIDSLMREARRLLRAAGCYRLLDAENYEVLAGDKAYERMACWLGEDKPTIARSRLKHASRLRAWQIVVMHK